jgi:hypothetical protein
MAGCEAGAYVPATRFWIAIGKISGRGNLQIAGTNPDIASAFALRATADKSLIRGYSLLCGTSYGSAQNPADA